MNWLTRLWRPDVVLPEGYDERLRAWRRLPTISDKQALAQARFVVVDVETSGLNTRNDRLLAIGACDVEGLRLRPGNNFEAIIRHDEPSPRDNILIHGIGPDAQARGEEPESALLRFLEFTGKQPLLAFHASFDQTMLVRDLNKTLGIGLRNTWIDLAQLAPALVPEARLAQAGLDEWLAYFGLRAVTRHHAADDAFATAELFLILLARARQRGLDTVSMLRAICEQQARLIQGGGIGGV